MSVTVTLTDAQARTLLRLGEIAGRGDLSEHGQRALAGLVERLAVQLTTEAQPRTPGDGCVLLGNYRVKHFGCRDHPDGTVTDVRTGEVVKS